MGRDIGSKKNSEKTLFFDQKTKILTHFLIFPGKMPVVILTDASFYAAGYVLLIEDYSIDQTGKTHKTYVPVSFGSKVFTQPI